MGHHLFSHLVSTPVYQYFHDPVGIRNAQRTTILQSLPGFTRPEMRTEVQGC
jgi:hypothetical protein